MFSAGLKLELRLRLRSGLNALGALGFLAVALTAVGLTLGQFPERLRPAGPAIGWAMIVLAFVYANADWWLDQLQSGLNQRLRAMARDYAGFVYGRLFGGWLASVPWFLVAAWLVTLFYSQPPSAFVALVIGLLVTSAALTALSAFVAALRVLLGNVGVFLGAMALPLALPFVVLGVGLVDSFSLASCAFMLGVSLLQTLVFVIATRWILSLV
ncbi:MAG: heme exporter protein CcmB [Alphaproteobacteria bacterium]